MTLRRRGYLTEQAGSGLGSLKQGKRLSSDSFVYLKKGDLLINRSKQFKSVNVLRVLKKVMEPSQGIRAIFVDPDNPSKKRMPGDKYFFVWADDLGNGEYFFVR
jgi:hypothetical protein